VLKAVFSWGKVSWRQGVRAIEQQGKKAESIGCFWNADSAKSGKSRTPSGAKSRREPGKADWGERTMELQVKKLFLAVKNRGTGREEPALASRAGKRMEKRPGKEEIRDLRSLSRWSDCSETSSRVALFCRNGGGG